MAFVPSEYSDTASAVEALAPLAISAGTQIATTAITGHRGGRRRHQPKAPPPPPVSAGFPVLPALALAGVAVVGAIGFALTRPKKPAAVAA